MTHYFLLVMMMMTMVVMKITMTMIKRRMINSSNFCDTKVKKGNS